MSDTGTDRNPLCASCSAQGDGDVHPCPFTWLPCRCCDRCAQTCHELNIEREAEQ